MYSMANATDGKCQLEDVKLETDRNQSHVLGAHPETYVPHFANERSDGCILPLGSQMAQPVQPAASVKKKKFIIEEFVLASHVEEKIIKLQNKKKCSRDSFSRSSGKPGFSKEYLLYLKKCEMQDMGIKEQDIRNVSLEQNDCIDKKLFIEMEYKRGLVKYNNMKEFSNRLPVYQKKEIILKLIENNQVVVLIGGTGCGKTTQVPQYILDSFIEEGKGSLCRILSAQLRRISTIGVAERVADERCVPCGQGNDVGYNIRLDKKMPRKVGSITFCTTGIVLKQLENNPCLAGVSHIIVDDVHEHDILSDFFLMNLKDIIAENKFIKVILMSANIKTQEISDYFGGCPIIEIDGLGFKVEVFTLEDMIEQTGYVCQQRTRPKKRVQNSRKRLTSEEIEQKEEYFRKIGPKYHAPTIEALRKWDEDQPDLKLIAKLIDYIASKIKDNLGTILVFLPGWQEIERLHGHIHRELGPKKFFLIPLHSKTSSDVQAAVLNRAPNGGRKIILSTNIAETSITINDCTIVIDCGQMNVKSFDPKKNVHSLQPHYISLANMNQREGRVARTQPGVCYHMFTTLRKSMLEEYPIPEMQRSTLEECILKIKILNKKCTVAEYFKTALHPPTPETVELSMNTLKKMGAITNEEQLTPLGFLLAKLPVDVYLGKMLLYGAVFSCLEPILSIAACLSFRDPFLPPLKQHENLYDNTRKEISRRHQSDLLLQYFALKEWETLWEYDESGKEAYAYAKSNYLSDLTLHMLYNLKYQFCDYLKQLRFINIADPWHKDYNRNSGNHLLIKAIICAAFYPNVAQVLPRDSKGSTFVPLKARTINKDPVAVHPTSINAFEPDIKTGWLAYYMKMEGSRVYIYDTTAVRVDALLLFGTAPIDEYVEDDDEGQGPFLLSDDWLQVNCPEDNIKHILALKQRLCNVLDQKICNPSTTDWKTNSDDVKVLKCAVSFLSSSL